MSDYEAASDILCLFRYSVKCDRETNAAIERAARAAGISPTQFVQSHFESIFEAAQTVQPEPDSTAAELALARSCGITVTQLRIHTAMKKQASQRGTFAGGVAAVHAATNIPTQTIRVMQSQLVKKGLLRRLKSAIGGTTAIFHVVSLGDDR
ncbi:MAG TPA: hypothetical protein VGV39_00185 [Mesorhizobium sp.]|jgi:hypothetical protein|uniref:hypothetical protein n=1 Tax=Mesorhizobium sp. TaxID=1871066 RepID=UPI002DDD1FE0|nr:hypothetical protein [Mesorhizobium sp.]HEV2501458.1 hypothetical protein [Mesorhizobium sp.]